MATEKKFKIVHNSTGKGNDTTNIEFTLDQQIHQKEIPSLKQLCIAYIFEDIIQYLKSVFEFLPKIIKAECCAIRMLFIMQKLNLEEQGNDILFIDDRLNNTMSVKIFHKATNTTISKMDYKNYLKELVSSVVSLHHGRVYPLYHIFY